MSNVHIQQVVFFDSRDKLRQSTTSITQPTPNNISDRSGFRRNLLRLPVISKRLMYTHKVLLWFRDADLHPTNRGNYTTIRFLKFYQIVVVEPIDEIGQGRKEPFCRSRACSNLLQIGLFWEMLALRWMLPCFASEPTSAESSVWQVRKWSSWGFILPVCMDEDARKQDLNLHKTGKLFLRYY